MTQKAVDMIQRREARRARTISRQRATMEVATPARVTLTTRVNLKATRHSFEDFLKRLFHASLAVV